MRSDDYPVAAPYRAQRSAAPAAPRPTKSFAKVVGLIAVCAASLLVGAFVIPGGSGSASVAPSPAPGDHLALTAVKASAPSASVPAAAPKVVFAPPPPATPKFPPHPLDAAPHVVPQLPPGPAYELAAAIDRTIDAKLAEAKVHASPPADDAEFLRRVSLDLTGTIPTYDRTVAFLLDSNPYKRAKLIDELLASPAYGRHFARQWADLLIKRDFDSNKNLRTEPFVTWLADQLNKGRGWDAIVRDILTTSGPESDTPAALFYLANQDNNQPSPAKLVGATANLFLGIQLQCAECHVHPGVDKWTQKDFWGMAAFFGHVRADREAGEKGKPQPGTATIHEVDRRAEPKGKAAKKTGDKATPPGATIGIPDPTDNKKTVGTAKAKFFEGTMPLLGAVPYRPTLAKWLTSAQDRYFAPAAVNRLWAHLFARGLVHPVEEMHPENAPSHPAVLKQLSEALARSGYDLKLVLRAACNTRAYQRTSRPLPENAEADEKLLARMPLKVIGAHELLASLATATDFQEQPSERPGPMRPGGNGRGFAGPVSLTRFFDTREYDDDLTEYAYGVPQVLKLMNTNLSQRSAQVAARVAKAAGADRRRAVEDLYLAALTRRPRPDEVERMLAYVGRQGDPQKGYAGVMWALLNSAEFVSNH
jgi:hypothetical protein